MRAKLLKNMNIHDIPVNFDICQEIDFGQENA